MAIHDIDKNSSGRTSPLPNSHDAQGIARMAVGTNSSNYVTDASNPLDAEALKSGLLKPVQTGTITIDGNSTAGLPITSRIAHNLPYVPIPMGFIHYSDAYIAMPTFLGLGLDNDGAGPDVAFASWMWLTADSVNVTANLFSGITEDWGTITVRYYLFQQSTQ